MFPETHPTRPKSSKYKILTQVSDPSKPCFEVYEQRGLLESTSDEMFYSRDQMKSRPCAVWVMQSNAIIAYHVYERKSASQGLQVPYSEAIRPNIDTSTLQKPRKD